MLTHKIEPFGGVVPSWPVPSRHVLKEGLEKTVLLEQYSSVLQHHSTATSSSAAAAAAAAAAAPPTQSSSAGSAVSSAEAGHDAKKREEFRIFPVSRGRARYIFSRFMAQRTCEMLSKTPTPAASGGAASEDRIVGEASAASPANESSVPSSPPSASTSRAASSSSSSSSSSHNTGDAGNIAAEEKPSSSSVVSVHLKELDEFVDFLARNIASIEPATFVSGWIYLQRLLTDAAKENLRFSPSNAKRLVLVALLIAEKMICDTPNTNTYWAMMSAEFSIDELNEMEAEFLSRIDWNLKITDEEFDSVANEAYACNF